MSRLISFFTSRVNSGSYIDQVKAKILVILIFVCLALLSVRAISLIGAEGSFLSKFGISLIMIAISFSGLIFMKWVGLKAAGVALSTGLLFVIVLGIYLTRYELHPLNDYLGGYYFALGILSITGLFGTRLSLLINITMIVSVAWIVLAGGGEVYTGEYEFLAKKTVLNITIVTIGMGAVLFFIMKVSEDANSKWEQSISVANERYETLSELFNQIKHATGIHQNTSGSIEQSSEQINSSATKQVSYVRQVEDSSEKLSEYIRNNQQAASYTAEQVAEAIAFLNLNRTIVDKTVQAVNDISTKIATIERISGQTDLLAINAAIEASQAGSNGTGFSVVAKEVKKLAEQTQNSSREIKEIVDQSIVISEEAQQHISSLFEKMSSIDDLVKQNQELADQQAIDVSAIRDAINRISQETQAHQEVSQTLDHSVKSLNKSTKMMESLVKS